MLIVYIILAVQSYWDLRYREIPTMVTLCGMLMGISYCLVAKRTLTEVFGAMVIGGIILLIGRVTREAVGYGDGLLLCMMGFFYTAEQLWGICISAFFLAGMVSIFLVVVFHKKGSYKIPFVPFLLMGNLLCFIGW